MIRFMNCMIGIMLCLTTKTTGSAPSIMEQDSKLGQVVSGYMETLPKMDIHEPKAQSIVRFLGQFRPPDARSPALKMAGEDRLIQKVESLMDKGLPLRLVLPSFPLKSKNTEKKVLSADPDLGELIALLTMDFVCNEISRTYLPGAMVTLVTDGVYCAEALGMPEAEAVAFEHKTKSIIEILGLGKHVEIISLSDFQDPRVQGKSYREILKVLDSFPLKDGVDYRPESLFYFCRNEVDCEFYRSQAKPEALLRTMQQKPFKTLPEAVRQELGALSFNEVVARIGNLLADEHVPAELRKSIAAFQKQLLDNYQGLSKKHLKALCPQIAEVISRRNKQFACLLSELIDPNQVIRLSNYPRQEDISVKLPFTLIYSNDPVPGTPWHHTPVVQKSDQGGIEISMQTRTGELVLHEDVLPRLKFPIRWMSQ